MTASRFCTAAVRIVLHVSQVPDGDVLRVDCERHNKELLESLRDDDFEEELMACTLEDVKHGRLTMPIPGAFCLCVCV